MKRIRACLCLALAAASLAPSDAFAARPRSDRRDVLPTLSRLDPAPARSRVPGEVVVRYRTTADRSDRVALRDEVDARSVEPLELARTEVLAVGKGSVDATIAALESSPDVVFAEPNYYYRASAVPNDPLFAQEWALNNTGQSVGGVSGLADADVDATEAWETTTGSRDVVVAIVDTGIAYDHPDLAANIWVNPGESGSGKQSNAIDDDSNGFTDDLRGWDFVDNDNTPRDLFGHGSHVAGTVGAAGNNGSGISGVTWNVSLMPLRVLDSEGSGTTGALADAISYAAANGADIINLSLGGPNFSLAVAQAITSATDVLVVTAAGNESANNDVTPSYPCNFQSANIVCVAATDEQDHLAGYSNYGTANVDLAAPGSRVLSTIPAFRSALSEGFEGDISGSWVTGGTGTRWSLGKDSFGFFATDSVSGRYEPNSDTWLQTASLVNLAGDDCRLSYAYSVDTQSNADLFAVEASTDGASWSRITQKSGSTGGWIGTSDDLSTFDGNSVYLRFRLTSDAHVERDGVSIDDLNVRCVSHDYTGSVHEFASGTSMAAPHVSGVAALVLSAAPNSSVAALRSALLSGVDPVTELIGKTATGGRLNAARTLATVTSSSIPIPGQSTSPTPSATPTPSVTPTPTPSPTPTPTPSPTPTPTPSPTPTPTPTPRPSSDPGSDEAHARSVTLDLRRHLVATGRVAVTDGFDGCIANVVVKIKRWGKTVARGVTGALGRYHVVLPDRPGRYVARVPRTDLPVSSCEAASSRARRHRL